MNIELATQFNIEFGNQQLCMAHLHMYNLADRTLNTT